MRNRAQSGPRGLREPLLAALDVEYARAAKTKNLDRMAEVSAVRDALGKLWPDLVQAPTPAPVPPPALVVVPIEEPPVMEAPTLPPAPDEASLSIRDILKRADPQPPITGNGQGERTQKSPRRSLDGGSFC